MDARRPPGITHVALVHRETSAGILNLLQAVADVVARHGCSLIVDAMSSFGALETDARKTGFDAVIAASGKCLEGPPGMAFAIIRRSALEHAEGNSHSLAMDLYDQWVYMQKTTQWRYTPPTHVVAAFDSAIDQYLKEGGRAARGARYAENCRILIAGLRRNGQRVGHGEGRERHLRRETVHIRAERDAVSPHQRTDFVVLRQPGADGDL